MEDRRSPEGLRSAILLLLQDYSTVSSLRGNHYEPQLFPVVAAVTPGEDDTVTRPQRIITACHGERCPNFPETLGHRPRDEITHQLAN